MVQAVQFGRSLSDDVQMVHITDDVEAAEKLREQIERQLPGVQFNTYPKRLGPSPIRPFRPIGGPR